MMDADDQPSERSAAARALWRHGHDLALEVDRDGVVRDASPATIAWFGGPNARLLDVVHPSDAARLLTLLQGEPPPQSTFRFAALPPSHGWRTVEISGATPGEGIVVIVARDVTFERGVLGTLERHREVLAMLAAREPLAAALDVLARAIEESSGGARVAVLVARGDDLELVAGPTLRAGTARAFARVRGAAIADVFPPAGALSGGLAEIASEQGLGFGWAAPVGTEGRRLALLLLFPGEKRFPNREEQAALDAAVPLAEVAIAVHDAQTTVRQAERSDPLTGVLGRQPFVTELEQLGRRSQDLIGVLLVSVEGLAELNEANGFGAGDALLQAVGSRLASVVRGRDVVGRCSGNRFAVACSSVRDANALEQFAERVSRMVAEPVVTSAGVVPVQIRVATALRSRKGGDAAAVLLDAERLLAAPSNGAAATGENVSDAAMAGDNVPGNEHGTT